MNTTEIIPTTTETIAVTNSVFSFNSRPTMAAWVNDYCSYIDMWSGNTTFLKRYENGRMPGSFLNGYLLPLYPAQFEYDTVIQPGTILFMAHPDYARSFVDIHERWRYAGYMSVVIVIDVTSALPIDSRVDKQSDFVLRYIDHNNGGFSIINGFRKLDDGSLENTSTGSITLPWSNRNTHQEQSAYFIKTAFGMNVQWLDGDWQEAR